MVVRAISIDLFANPARAIAGLDAFGVAAERNAKLASQQFELASAKVGGSLRAIDAQAATFGLPFTGALGKMGTSLQAAEVETKTLGSTLSSVSGTVVLAAGAAFAIVGAEAVKMASEFEASHARLVQATTNAGESFDAFAGKVSAADANMEKLGFTNADTENSLSRLIVATKDAGRATELLHTAADIARARNLSLSEATDLVTKAEQGRYIQLTRLGIISKDAANQFRSTADAINYLNKTYGGQAQAYADTFAGKLATLKATATDLGVAVGEALIPKLEAIATAVLTGINALSDLNAATGGALGRLTEIGAVTGVAYIALSKLIGVGEKIGATFKSMSDASGAAATANAAAASTSADVTAAQTLQGQSALSLAAATDASTAAVEGGSVAAAEAIAGHAALAEEFTAEGIAELNLTVARAREIALTEALTVEDIKLAAAIQALVTGQVAEDIGSQNVTRAYLASVAAKTKLTAASREAASAQAEYDSVTGATVATEATAITGLGALTAGFAALAVGAGVVQQVMQKNSETWRDWVGQTGGNAAQNLIPGFIQRGEQSLGLIGNTKPAGAGFQAADVTLGQQFAAQGALNPNDVEKLQNDLAGSFIANLEAQGMSSQDAQARAKTIVATYAQNVRTALLQAPVSPVTGKSTATEGTGSPAGVAALSGTGVPVTSGAAVSFEHGQTQVVQSLDATALAQARVDDATKRLSDDYARGGVSAKQLSADHEYLNESTLKLAGIQRKLSDAQNDDKDASQRQSAALKNLKADLDRLHPGDVAADWTKLQTATSDATAVEVQSAAIQTHVQATADEAAGAVLSLADAYDYLGKTASQNSLQTLQNFNKAATSQTDAVLGLNSAQDQYQQSVTALNQPLNQQTGNMQTAAAAADQLRQKQLAVRDAMVSVSDVAENVSVAQEGIAKAYDQQRQASVALQKAQYDEQQSNVDLAHSQYEYTLTLHGAAAAMRIAGDQADELARAELDANNAVTQSNIDRKSATLDVRDAQTALQNARYTEDPETIARAELALREAKLRQREATQSQTDAQQKQNDLLHGYKAGSTEAIAATKQLQDAEYSHRSAIEAVTQAQFGEQDAAHGVVSAQHQLRDAHNQAASAALALQRAEDDLAGKLDSKAGAAIDKYNTRLDTVKKNALGVAQATGEAALAMGKTATEAIGAEVATLEAIENSNPALRGVFDQVIRNLLVLASHLPQPAPEAAGTAPTLTAPGHGGRVFAEGGWIDAPPGQAALRVVHGGEYVVSHDELQGRPRPDSPFVSVLSTNAPATAAGAAAGALPSATATTATGTPGRLTDQFQTTGANLIGGLATGVKDKWTKDLDPFLANAKKSIQGHFAQSNVWLVQSGQDITTGLYRGIQTGYLPVNDFFDQLPQVLGAKTASAVGATSRSWQHIEGAFSSPVSWSIKNVLNPLVLDINAIAGAIGLKAIASPVPGVPAGVGAFAKGGMVHGDQLAVVHHGEGIIPAKAMTGISPAQFEGLRTGVPIAKLPAYEIGGIVPHAGPVAHSTEKKKMPSYGEGGIVPPSYHGGGIVGAPMMLHGYAQGGIVGPATGQPLQWDLGFLSLIQAPQTIDNLGLLRGWQTAETGGGMPSRALYNLLATTQPEPHSYPINTVGVQAYPNIAEGMYANAQALLQDHPGYALILGDLRKGNVDPITIASRDAQGFDTWGTGSGHLQAVLRSLGDKTPPSPPATGGGGLPGAGGGQLPDFAINIVKSIVDSLKASEGHLGTTHWPGVVAGAGGLLSFDTIRWIQEQAQKFTGQRVTGGGAGGRGQPGKFAPYGYANPLRGLKGLVPERIDQGVDYAGEGPIYAIGDGVVLTTNVPGWPNGVFISYQLTKGPAAGLVPFAAEDINPSVKVGQTVNSNTVLGQVFRGPTGIEVGWSDGHGNALGRAQYIEGRSTQAGVAFNQFLKDLGAPGGILQPGTPSGTLPPGFPKLAAGGVVDFPAAGGTATLHGKELVTPLPTNFDVRSLQVPSNVHSTGTTTAVSKHYTINVQSLDPRQSSQLVLEALRNIEARQGYVPVRTAAA